MPWVAEIKYHHAEGFRLLHAHGVHGGRPRGTEPDSGREHFQYRIVVQYKRPRETKIHLHRQQANVPSLFVLRCSNMKMTFLLIDDGRAGLFPDLFGHVDL